MKLENIIQEVINAGGSHLISEAVELKNVDDFVKLLEKELKPIFKKSAMEIRKTTGFGRTVDVIFTLAKDKSEVANGIMGNDIAGHRFSINGVGGDAFDKDGNLSENLRLEAGLGGTKYFTVADKPHMAFGSKKVSFRKSKGSPNKIVLDLKKYFVKLKTDMKKNIEILPKYEERQKFYKSKLA